MNHQEKQQEILNGCEEKTCNVSGCMYCICGGTDDKGKKILCLICLDKAKAHKKEVMKGCGELICIEDYELVIDGIDTNECRCGDKIDGEVYLCHKTCQAIIDKYSGNGI